MIYKKKKKQKPELKKIDTSNFKKVNINKLNPMSVNVINEEIQVDNSHTAIFG